MSAIQSKPFFFLLLPQVVVVNQFDSSSDCCIGQKRTTSSTNDKRQQCVACNRSTYHFWSSRALVIIFLSFSCNTKRDVVIQRSNGMRHQFHSSASRAHEKQELTKAHCTTTVLAPSNFPLCLVFRGHIQKSRLQLGAFQNFLFLRRNFIPMCTAGFCNLAAIRIVCFCHHTCETSLHRFWSRLHEITVSLTIED